MNAYSCEILFKKGIDLYELLVKTNQQGCKLWIDFSNFELGKNNKLYILVVVTSDDDKALLGWFDSFNEYGEITSKKRLKHWEEPSQEYENLTEMTSPALNQVQGVFNYITEKNYSSD